MSNHQDTVKHIPEDSLVDLHDACKSFQNKAKGSHFGRSFYCHLYFFKPLSCSCGTGGLEKEGYLGKRLPKNSLPAGLS